MGDRMGVGLDELIEECISISQEAYKRGLISASGGNISARVKGGDMVIIKRTGASFRNLKPSDIIVIDLDGKILEGKGKPSKEVNMHLGIYMVRSDVNAVIHTHSPAATAYAVCGREVPLVTVQALKILGKCPLVGYGPPGSLELAEKTKEVFKDRTVKAAVLQSHGATAVGSDLEEAYNHADLLEATAQISLFTTLIGKTQPIPY
ncbi:MAG: class II aldolase/adducin family protein [Candidatus Bathyarchaeia archaeon]